MFHVSCVGRPEVNKFATVVNVVRRHLGNCGRPTTERNVQEALWEPDVVTELVEDHNVAPWSLDHLRKNGGANSIAGHISHDKQLLRARQILAELAGAA